ncbi:MAG: hypothetical protein VYE17_11930 [Pseudomonadota bacterium]|nr:hypothetical protein [Pseudomonadota bacterium]
MALSLSSIDTLKTETLPGPFSKPPGDNLEIKPEVLSLVRSQVQALLQASPAWRELPAQERKQMAHNLVKVAAYSASLIHDDWHQSRKIGQIPLVREQTTVEGRSQPEQHKTPPARTQADEGPAATEFAPRAANNVARITEDTLNAIAFPTFVADLLKGTFQAVVDASIQQMEAYGELLANVAKTVDEFMADNISNNQARDWLSNSYPQLVRLDTSSGEPRVRIADGGGDSEAAQAAARRDMNVPEDQSIDDDDSLETVLVPAARRKLAQSRQQVLATMVLMGINRIVVTSGRVKASMGFRIDTTDRARAESASQFDFKNETSIGYSSWLSPVSASSKTTVAYVSSSKKNSESEINVNADLTGEVDLKFKSETFPLERFADTGVISNIQQNTPVPGANKPITGNNAGNA